jgi:hypothetical protein
LAVGQSRNLDSNFRTVVSKLTHLRQFVDLLLRHVKNGATPGKTCDAAWKTDAYERHEVMVPCPDLPEGSLTSRFVSGCNCLVRRYGVLLMTVEEKGAAIENHRPTGSTGQSRQRAARQVTPMFNNLRTSWR